MENMIKEHKLYTRSDRTSCHRWEANQFRLFLHTGAYWLLHRLRRAAPRKSLWRKATFETLRRAFLKIAVRINELKSRVRIALPSAYPYSKALVRASGSPCLRPIRIAKPSSRWQAASPPKAPDPGGTCRRISPEPQPPTAPSIHLEKPPSTRPLPLAPRKSGGVMNNWG
jgi:hypothetical protein